MMKAHDIQLLRRIIEDNSSESLSRVTFYYLTNRDGSIRWLFPKALTSPLFLLFYPALSLRSRFFRNFLRLAFHLRFLLLKELTLEVTNNSLLAKLAAPHRLDQYSIYMGINGPDRKAVIVFLRHDQTYSFAKIAMSDKGMSRIRNERKITSGLARHKFYNLVLPTILSHSEHHLEITNIMPKGARQPKLITDVHIAAFQQLSRIGFRKTFWEIIPMQTYARNNIFNISNSSADSAYFCGFKKSELSCMLIKLQKSIPLTTSVYTALAHGDFTPWNCYLDDKCIFIFDWECADFQFPVLYDFFHFIFQTGILVSHFSYEQIKTDLTRTLRLRKMKELIDGTGIDINIHYRIYLLHIASKYISSYAEVPNPHQQMGWMIKVWHEAIHDVNTNGFSLH